MWRAKRVRTGTSSSFRIFVPLTANTPQFLRGGCVVTKKTARKSLTPDLVSGFPRLDIDSGHEAPRSKIRATGTSPRSAGAPLLGKIAA